MIDSLTKRPIKVSDDEDAEPYIFVQLDQLDLVKKLLEEAGHDFYVEEDAISFNGQPYTSVVELRHRADVTAIQKLLDDNEDINMARHGSAPSGHRG